MARVGKNFLKELKAAGLSELPFSWSSDGDLFFSDAMTPEQVTAVIAVFAAHDPDALDQEEVKEREEAQALKADAKFQNIVRKTPEQARTWTESNFPTLTPAERKDLATIVMAIGVLGRLL